MKHQKSLDQCFCQFVERRAPLHTRKAPLLKTFWPRFCETRTFISDISSHPAGIALPRTAWVRLSRFRNLVGRFRSCLHKWDKAPSAACECGAEEPADDYVVLHCPIHLLPVEFVAWRFWMTRQSHSCSTPAPRSSAAKAKQWITRTGSKDEEGDVKSRPFTVCVRLRQECMLSPLHVTVDKLYMIWINSHSRMNQPIPDGSCRNNRLQIFAKTSLSCVSQQSAQLWNL